MNKFVYYIVILFVFLGQSLFAQNNNYLVQTRLYNYADGLLGNKVNYTVQDNKGFIWCGTQYGLCRFDGEKFEAFTHKTHGLCNKAISALWFDGFSAIIIAYQDNSSDLELSFDSIQVMDINTFKVFAPKKYYQNFPIDANQIKSIYYNSHTGRTSFCLANYHNENTFLNLTDSVWTITKKRVVEPKPQFIKKVIYFTTTNKKEVAHIEDYLPNKIYHQANYISNLNGLFLYNGYHQYLLYRDSLGVVFKRRDSLNQNYIYKIDYAGTIKLLGYDTAQYHHYTFHANYNYPYFANNIVIDNLQTKNLFTIEQGVIPLKLEKDITNTIKNKWTCCMKDNLGNYWISSTEGLLKVTLHKNIFKNYFSSKLDTFSGCQAIREIKVYKHQTIACLENYVVLKTNKKNKIITERFIHTTWQDHQFIWLASDKIMLYDTITEKLVTKTSSISDEIWTTYRLNEHEILLGCSKNLDIYHTKKNSIQHINHNSYKTPQLVYRIFKNKENQIVCVADNGIYILNAFAEIVDYIGKDAPIKNNLLPFVGINDLYIDNQNIYWFATVNNGLYSWDRVNNKFNQYTVEDGFLSSKLYRIESDRFNNLWISTDFGLAQFNTQNHNIKTYTMHDGLPSNEFNRTSSCYDSIGNLYFGSIDGYTCFNPQKTDNETAHTNYNFIINSLDVYNAKTSVLEDALINYNTNGILKLYDDFKNFNIRVLLMDLEEQEHLYAYQLIGFENQKHFSNNGKISYNNLPYGSYTLTIEAQQANGTWNKTKINIPILIIKPFYKTGWFLVLLAICLICLIILYFRYRTRKIKKENQKLEQTVEERTIELKESLNEQTALLQEVHHRVKNNLQFIGAMLKMQLNTIKDETNQAILIETSRRINSMSLVHEMLYNKDKLEYVSVKNYLSELISKLNDFVYDSNVKVKFNFELDEVNFNINNCVSIGMVTSEIISNSFKYAFHHTKNPTIDITLRYTKNEKQITYTIKDNGIGLHNNEKSTGLGMRLIDIFSRQMEAEYEHKNDNGLVYTFKIPFENNDK